MRFTKMHGLGNSYIYVNCFEETVCDAPALARQISDCHTGVGSDGLILICPSDKAACRMEMYNKDGSRGEMCGNGIRCVAKYASEHGISGDNPMRIETDAGVLTLDLTIERGRVRQVRVDMGPPRLEPGDLPTTLPKEQMIDLPIEIGGHMGRMTCVSMGNPHAVIHGIPLAEFTAEVLAKEGAGLEHDPRFPQRINVHFVEINSPDEVTMLTWERGSGATQACGTGAAAVCVAGVLTGRYDRALTAHLPGGDLFLEWLEANNHVYMTGPAVEIFSGQWNGPA